MIKLRRKKKWSPPIEGASPANVLPDARPHHVAVIPHKIPFIKPRLTVAAGDRVLIGSELFHDKRQPAVRFLSPGGGEIKEIRFGPRRVIEAIVIELDETEQQESFTAIPQDRLSTIERDVLVSHLAKGGVWPFIRSLPYRKIPAPSEEMPPVIFVSFEAKEPFQPDPAVWMKGGESLFSYGIQALQKLGKRVVIGFRNPHENLLAASGLNEDHDLSFIQCDGAYPACDPGTLLYHTRKTREENRSWYINGPDVLLLASLLKTGLFPTERIVSVAGSAAASPGHVKTRLGAPLSAIAGDQPRNSDTRWVVGGLLTGYKADPNGFMGLYETSLTLLPEGNEREFLGFARPGFNRPSFSTAFLSAFNKGPFKTDCNTHGEERACVNCGNCARVCPVDILPQFTLKALAADEIEDALAHGLLDCVECGLCSYVCPSKVELLSILKAAKAAYYKEIHA